MNPPSSTMRMLSRIPWILLLLLLIGVAWSIRPISDPDILWHLRTGQWMLAHGDVIRHDVFSATRHGCAWVSIPWLYEVMIAKLHAAIGWGGLTLWQVLMVAAITLQTAFLVWLLRRTERNRWDWKWPNLSVPAALAVLLMLRLLQMRINCRPELCTYLFIGTFLILLTLASRNSEFRIQNSEDNFFFTTKNEERRTKNPAFRLLWLLPLLQILWTNTHGAFILGPALVWAYAAAAWLAYGVARGLAARERPYDPDGLAPETEGEWPRHQAGPAPTRLTVVAALTTLACLATPYGLAGMFYPFHLFSVLTDPLYKTGIVEAHPVDLATAFDSGSLGYALLACLVFALLGLLGRLLDTVRGGEGHWSLVIGHGGEGTADGCPLPVIHPGYLAVCAAMAYLSLTAVRNIPLLPLVVVPLVASGIEYAADGFAAVLALLIYRLRSGSPALPGERGVSILHSRPAHFLAHALLALGLILTYRAIVSERFYESLGWRMRFAIGYSDHEHPLAAGNFVEQHRAELSCRTLYGDTRSANLFLARFGPQWPVYFDGRHAEIYDPPIFRTAANTYCDPALFVREAAAYGIGLACFSLAELKESRSPLAIALGRTNTWRLIFLDDCAALYAANTSSNTAFVARYGLPCAPTNAMLQRALFADWLTRQGRANLAALHDPANRSLETGVLAGCVVNALQLGGLWAPTRNLEAMRFCRLASFVDHLGWNVVADDIYEQALRGPDSLPATLPRAIRHAHVVCKAVTDPALQSEMRARMRLRAAELQRIDPHNPLAAEALLEIITSGPTQ